MRRLRLSLRPVERRDALKFGPCVHPLAYLEEAGGGVEVELVWLVSLRRSSLWEQGPKSARPARVVSKCHKSQQFAVEASAKHGIFR